jgi:D-aminopeptidase
VGIRIGTQEPGSNNAITDVEGVRVGHVTLVEGEGPLRIGEGPVRTGVTSILPPGHDWYREPVEAGHFVFNGAGTTTGLSLIEEFGKIETPVLLTNTLSVGAAYEGIVSYMVERIFQPRGEVPWFNPVVGETSDAFLNDIGGRHVRPHHAAEAVEVATGGPVVEGNVGAGTGTSALGYKGGIGTSSRLVHLAGETAVVGVLVQSNFGGRFTVDGVDMSELRPANQPHHTVGSSIMIIVATDMPLNGRLLNRLAKRATFGLARSGSDAAHGSGDYVITFSTTQRKQELFPAMRQVLAEEEGALNAGFAAVAAATEEAILNSLFQATRMVGRDGHVSEALPIDRVVAVGLCGCGQAGMFAAALRSSNYRFTSLAKAALHRRQEQVGLHPLIGHGSR